MRLWHKNLIDVLPRERLVAQWREVSAIVGSIQKKGTPNHILVNYVTDYTYEHLISYAWYIREEMTRRGYRTMNSVWNKIISLNPVWNLIPKEELFKDHMDGAYLMICFYNLMEKWLRGGISNEDWIKIDSRMEELGYEPANTIPKMEVQT